MFVFPKKQAVCTGNQPLLFPKLILFISSVLLESPVNKLCINNKQKIYQTDAHALYQT